MARDVAMNVSRDTVKMGIVAAEESANERDECNESSTTPLQWDEASA